MSGRTSCDTLATHRKYRDSHPQNEQSGEPPLRDVPGSAPPGHSFSRTPATSCPWDMAPRKVAVIGAGASGLCALKCCLDEGLEPTCFERSKDIGGLWRFEEHPEDGRASIYRSVIINTSKEMMCFSDFPIPEDFPNYMHNSKIMEYFRMYAQHFDLLRHIRFRTSVCRVSKRPDFASSGQWEVVTESEGKQEAAVFDAVLVCSGHHTNAHLPLSSFPGLEKFEGCYLHSRDYKSPQAFFGKRVVVVGIGNSGIDIAVELSHTAKQVFLSTRRGSWVLYRVADNGYPFDFSYLSRFMQLVHNLVPTSILNFFMEWKLNARFDHTLYGLKPKHGILDQHPTVNDDLPNRIISGRVRVKPNIQEFTETSAIFEDGTREDVDAVVFATGYSFSFPFLEGCVKVVENQIPLYKFMFPPDLEKPTLAFIGLIQPWGAIMPISELQSRWATHVFKGLQGLPPPADMLAEITQTKQRMAERYVKSQRHTIQVDYIPYMDDLARQLGVKPNLLSLFLTDPKIAMEVAFGPCTPYQYRLRGPGAWAGARAAILGQRQRMVSALQPWAARRPARPSALPHVLTVLFSIGMIVATLVYVSLSA
ncbi:LOW QUALITY PROTEIN: flavin-containing monooxygenase 5-like [Haemorhous mexicanus]|uniref:LOW QUALITY PROTEIN: flavin-containing monooxygenase 5-like n=1 Tax=Haemorhous mexicanus TaxID=30427 RepID=UPI0028BE8DAD|nr:LOW QUALITY PROTEIN: flavin-containing monooxygenase 5-like [Haemorhous mexicanus]